ncbi:MAG: hypothetical protein AB8B51_03425 [Sedimentitalea sp.]
MAPKNLKGPELKKMIKLGKGEAPVSFAFSLDPQDDHVFMVDRKTLPQGLGTKAKAMTNTKAAFGTFNLRGKTLELKCARVITGMAKKLKLHMRKNSMSLNIVIMDEKGQMLESAVEELPFDPEFDEKPNDTAQAGDGGAQGNASQGNDAPVDNDAQVQTDNAPQSANAKANGLTATALAGRFKAVQPIIMALKGPVGDKLKPHVKDALVNLKSNNLEKADKIITLLETTAAKVKAAKAKAAAATPAIDTTALSARATTLKAALATLPAAARDKLTVKLDAITNALHSNDADKAGQQLDALEKTVSALNAKLAGAAPKQNAASDTKAVAVAQSSLSWAKTRSSMEQELNELKSAIDAATVGIAGLEQVSSKSGALLDHLISFDTKLQDTLDKLSKAPQGTDREALSATARGLVGAYETELNTPFFKAVDDNGFVKTNIRSAALAALQQVGAALDAQA